MAGTFLKKIDLRQFMRYYQVAIVNTLFGYSCYATLIWLSLDMFAAQFLSHAAGTLFNYVTYSRYAFREQSGSLVKFVVSYTVNYLFSACILWISHLIVDSEYVSGLIATVLVSLINFFILKNIVFSGRGQG